MHIIYGRMFTLPSRQVQFKTGYSFCLPDSLRLQRLFAFLKTVLSAGEMRCASLPIWETGLFPGRTRVFGAQTETRERAGVAPHPKQGERTWVSTPRRKGLRLPPSSSLFSERFLEGTHPTGRKDCHRKLPGPLAGISQRRSSLIGWQGRSHIQSFQTASWCLTVGIHRLPPENIGCERRCQREIPRWCRQQRAAGRELENQTALRGVVLRVRCKSKVIL